MPQNYRSGPHQERRYFDFCSAPLPQFQCRQAKQGEDYRENPKPNDDGVFFPTGQFEMVMKRGHDENPPARRFETDYLQNHRDRFNHENAAHYGQEQFLLTADRDDAHHAANGERSRIPHKDFRRMTVEPEEPEARTN